MARTDVRGLVVVLASMAGAPPGQRRRGVRWPWWRSLGDPVDQGLDLLGLLGCLRRASPAAPCPRWATLRPGCPAGWSPPQGWRRAARTLLHSSSVRGMRSSMPFSLLMTAAGSTGCRHGVVDHVLHQVLDAGVGLEGNLGGCARPAGEARILPDTPRGQSASVTIAACARSGDANGHVLRGDVFGRPD